mgnify:CR=1 FL=1
MAIYSFPGRSLVPSSIGTTVAISERDPWGDAPAHVAGGIWTGSRVEWHFIGSLGGTQSREEIEARVVIDAPPEMLAKAQAWIDNERYAAERADRVKREHVATVGKYALQIGFGIVERVERIASVFLIEGRVTSFITYESYSAVGSRLVVRVPDDLLEINGHEREPAWAVALRPFAEVEGRASMYGMMLECAQNPLLLDALNAHGRAYFDFEIDGPRTGKGSRLRKQREVEWTAGMWRILDRFC